MPARKRVPRLASRVSIVESGCFVEPAGNRLPDPASANREDEADGGWRRLFPPAQWLPAYRAADLPRDALAGVTLAAYAIPVSLAYATLAGLPPERGLYGYLIGGLCYALFGSSRQLAIGPTSAISMLVGTTVAGLALDDPARWMAIAALAALVFGAMSILAWLFRLSALVSFISETILLGFKAGAAFTIAMTQLPKLFGVKGGGSTSSNASGRSSVSSATRTSRCSASASRRSRCSRSERRRCRESRSPCWSSRRRSRS